MDRFPGYQSLLSRIEHKKAQVKSQLPIEHCHLVDEFAVFVLDQFNKCFDDVPSSVRDDDHFGTNGTVTRAPTSAANNHNREATSGPISSGQTVSPVSPPTPVSQSTIPANIEVKVEDVSDGQSIQLGEFVKKEEDDGGEYVLDCDCGECEICRVKREMKEELDESGFETELGGNSGLSIEGGTRVKKEEEDGGEYVLDCDCGECEICRVKREMKEEFDESGETEQMEDCVKQEIKEELEDGEMIQIKEEEEEDASGEVEGERPNKIQRMDRVLGNVPVGSLSPSTNGISINVEYIDDQMATSSTHPITIEDHTQPSQPVTVPFPTPIVTPPSSSSQHVNETIRDELLNAEPMMDNVGFEVRAEEFDREQTDHDISIFNQVNQDGGETEVDDNQNDEEEGNEAIENREDPSAGDEQVPLPAESFVKRIKPDEFGNRVECNYQQCGRRMKTKQHLISHIRTHTGEKPFKCSVEGCDRAFVLDAQLKEHLNVHSGSRPFVCTWPGCEDRFANKATLIVHLRTHTGERPYQCDQCDATFTQHNNLVTHRRTHTGSRPFVCTWPECGQAFYSSSHLKNHSTVHSNESQFVCDVTGCGKAFKRSSGLWKHQKAKHN